MFDLTGKNRRWSPAHRVGSVRRSRARCTAPGPTVALHGTRTGPLEDLAAELGERAHVTPANLSDAAAVEALPKQAADAMGSGRYPGEQCGDHAGQPVHADVRGRVGSGPERQPDGGLPAVQAVLRGMMKARWGRIIGITSVVGVTGNPGQGNYAAAKAGMIGMSKSLAAEVASRNVTVNCVAPGFIETAMTDKLTDDQKTKIMGAIPAGRMGTSEEIAAAALFLASPESELCHRTDDPRERRDGDDLTDPARRGCACPGPPGGGIIGAGTGRGICPMDVVGACDAMLRAHGIDLERRGDWLVDDGRALTLGAWYDGSSAKNGFAYLDINVVLPDQRIIEDSFVGVGDTDAELAASAIEAFRLGGLHVLLAALWDEVDPHQVTVETWWTPEADWTAYLGNAVGRNLDGGQETIVPDGLPEAFEARMASADPTKELHWFSMFYTQEGDGSRTVEAVVDNDPDARLSELVADLEWDRRSHYYSTRVFVIAAKRSRKQGFLRRVGLFR